MPAYPAVRTDASDCWGSNEAIMTVLLVGGSGCGGGVLLLGGDEQGLAVQAAGIGGVVYGSGLY